MAESDQARLYRQIVEQTKEEALLARMRLHGFWSPTEGLPTEPPEETAERTAIAAELAQLRKSAYIEKNPDKALAAERKRRWQESKQRRAEAKKKRLAEEAKRREAWQAHCANHTVHLGSGVSAGLQQTTSDLEALNRRGLPILHASQDVATQIGIKLSVLRWLTYHRKGATVVHYHRFGIPKKTGGIRHISAPKKALAHAQHWVLDNILYKLTPDACAHGFVPGRSIVTNATPHTNKPVVLNLDLKDFFPTVTFRRVKGLFRKLGYSEHVAIVLALLCTEPPRVAAEVDGKTYFVALGQRMLPQGACTSPAITNLLCRRLDRRLTGLATKHGFTYTRYADDLTFSGTNGKAVGRLLRSVRSIVQAEGFTEHPSKTRVMRRGGRQEVTGVTVNTRPTIARDEVKRLRAILHNAAKHGLASQNRENHPRFADYLRGKVEFIAMVDPQRGAKLRQALEAALRGPGTPEPGV